MVLHNVTQTSKGPFIPLLSLGTKEEKKGLQERGALHSPLQRERESWLGDHQTKFVEIDLLCGHSLHFGRVNLNSFARDCLGYLPIRIYQMFYL